MPRRRTLVLVVTGVLAALAIGYLGTRPDGADGVRGTVVTATGEPIAGATVRIQATDVATTTDDAGRFVLAGPEGAVRVTAWAPGFYIGGGDEHEPGDRVAIALQPHPQGDDPSYGWLTVEAPGRGEAKGCAACHSREGTDVPHLLPVDEWRLDAHSQATHNVRFLTMYLGTDAAGNRSPDTRYATTRDYGMVPLRPDPDVPYYGPGYKLDFPGTAGNCASCHAPAAAADDPYAIDPSALSGVAAEGVSCDYCHKVWDVVVEEHTGLPAPHRPGVLSTELRRPPDGQQFFAGPFDDVAPGEDVFSPLQLESRFCASCHFGVFWDTVVYDSFGEWLRSPYSDPVTGQTCQDCHMPATGVPFFALPEEGGNQRDPGTIHSHLMPGAADAELLRGAVELHVDARRSAHVVEVEVTITNVGAGHHVPTDSPLRHLILTVAAADEAGAPLDLIAGPTVPIWGGTGDPELGYYGGLAGTAYAKVLEELWTERAPTGAYWNPTRLVSDNRIPALGRDKTRYTFAGASGPVGIDVQLVFRRAFIELMDQKGWAVPDVVLATRHLVVAGE